MEQAQKDSGRDPGSTSLISKNVRVAGRRTSIRLEAEMWDALHAVATIQKISIHDLCDAVYATKKAEGSLSSAIRVFLLNYFRSSVMSKSTTAVPLTRLNEAKHAKCE